LSRNDDTNHPAAAAAAEHTMGVSVASFREWADVEEDLEAILLRQTRNRGGKRSFILEQARKGGGA